MINDASNNVGGFWRRFWAFMIDVYVVLGVIMPLGYLTYVAPREIAFLMILLTTFTGSIYFIYTHYKWGQSVGKIILGLKVQTLTEHPLSLQQSISRYFIDAMLSAVWLFIFLSVMFSISYNEYSELTSMQRIMMFGNNFLIMMVIGWVWFTLNAVPLLFSEKKRSMRDFFASTSVIKISQDSHYPKKKMFFLFILAILGQAFINQSLSSSHDLSIKMTLCSISLIIYTILFFLIVRYTKEIMKVSQREITKDNVN